MTKYYDKFEALNRYEIKASDLESGQVLITDNEVAMVVEDPCNTEGSGNRVKVVLVGQSWNESMFGPMTVYLDPEHTLDAIFPNSSRYLRNFRNEVEKQKNNI